MLKHMNRSDEMQELSPVEVHDQLLRQWIVVVDVREPAEYAQEHIPGAMLMPLSSFDPHALPAPGQRRVVFCCASGKRSAVAIRRCQESAVPATAHLRGGLQAWKAAQLPTITPDRSTGAAMGRR